MNKGNVLLGVLAGAATGALLGVLFAPHKGTVTRKKISRQSGAFAGGVKENINVLLDDITKNLKKVKEDVSEFAEQKFRKTDETKKDVKAT